MDMTSRITRRHALRLIGGGALAAAPILRLTEPALAARGWCFSDPTVQIDGIIVHLYVSGQLDKQYDVSGPTKVVVRVPPGVDTAVLDSDNGFGQGYDVSFAEDRRLKAGQRDIEIAADVYVPSTTRGRGLPILVQWVPDGSIEVSASVIKQTNAWISLSTKVARDPMPGMMPGPMLP